MKSFILLNIIASVKYEIYKNANQKARSLRDIDVHDYALKNPENLLPELLRHVLEQYRFLQKLAIKVPSWAKNPDILGALTVNIEQSTSEEVALFKFSGYQWKNTLDLTGGFGIDSYFISKHASKHVYCESDANLTGIVAHNFEALAIKNVTFKSVSAEDFLQSDQNSYDLIYLDPDRRNEINSKLVRIEDCSPDLTRINSHLLQVANEVWVKYSPLLDINRAVSQLQFVYEVLIISSKNEVKELLFKLKKTKQDNDFLVKTVNLYPVGKQEFTFIFSEEVNAPVMYREPLQYLYEPNAAILKSGAFKLISSRFNLYKIAPNTHYYTSENLISDFPGRIFHVNEYFSPSTSNLKKISNSPFNVLSRNFPLKPETIRQKYRLRDGGETFLIFTTDNKNNKIVLNCNKIIPS
jgi:16S rRNA G966 N2-methylase RsmD